MNKDLHTFEVEECEETLEPKPAQSDRDASDFVKKNFKLPESQEEEHVHTPDEEAQRTGTAVKKLKKAVNKMALALIGGGKKKE